MRGDPNRSMRIAALSLLCVAIVLTGGPERASQKANSALPPASIPTFSTENLGRQAFLYVGGKYVTGKSGEHFMRGAAYVQVWVPKHVKQPYPLVFFHGAGQTATYWQQTPDGRPGWAYYLIEQGYVLYMMDYPARGRSPYVPEFDGPKQIRSAETIEGTYTNGAVVGKWPRAKNLTQWPGDGPDKGRMGDPVFDAFYKTQVDFIAGGEDVGADVIRDAGIALLDRIGGPVILITHSQGGGIGWPVADARPNLVKAIVAIEPAGPPMENVDRVKVVGRGKASVWGPSSLPLHYDPPVSDPSELKVVHEEKAPEPGMVPCWRQQDPARKLVNLENIPVLITTGDGSYHYIYDHCTADWLDQAGVKATYLPLDKVGIKGNAHEMMVEKNNLEIIKFIDGWMRKNVH